jgi:hypothetical protein
MDNARLFGLCDSVITAVLVVSLSWPATAMQLPPSLTVDPAVLLVGEMGPVVKDAPYAAEASTEVIQTFLDGNRIVRRTTAKVYRDSRGRTRREQIVRDVAGLAIAGPPQRTVTISDPEAGSTFMISVDGAHSQMQRASGTEQRGEAPTLQVAGVPPSRNETALIVPAWPVKEEKLGPRTIEGTAVEGTRVTLTIPAGAVGNERAFQSVTERWFSRELQITIASRQTDPRFGEIRYQLTKIDRSEPPAELFQIQRPQ